MDAPAARRVDVETLSGFIARAFIAAGLRPEDARTVGALMAEADLYGSDGHGVIRLANAVKRIKAGGINTHPEIKVARERGAMALLDGDDAMGHLVMKRAAEVAMEKARAQGVGWVGAFNSNHAGPASLYARMPLRHDMIGIYAAVGSANHLPPWGGVDMLLSTNPIAIGVPSGRRPPIVLDMATTVAAYGKVKTYLMQGKTMPEGWMIDREGKPLTDPKRAHEGFLLPIGGPKGYGLALMLGILAGTLNGAAFGRDVIDFNADMVSRTNTGHFIIAVDIAAFGDVETFKATIDRVWEEMKSSALMPGFEEILLPGERTERVHQDRAANGIPIVPELDRTLAKVAEELGIAAL
jgi:LDH2 family malate/lactate/ureidoglycolate dehydrogenase